jgi:hypothetical protein
MSGVLRAPEKNKNSELREKLVLTLREQETTFTSENGHLQHTWNIKKMTVHFNLTCCWGVHPSNWSSLSSLQYWMHIGDTRLGKRQRAVAEHFTETKHGIKLDRLEAITDVNTYHVFIVREATEVKPQFHPGGWIQMWQLCTGPFASPASFTLKLVTPMYARMLEWLQPTWLNCQKAKR